MTGWRADLTAATGVAPASEFGTTAVDLPSDRWLEVAERLRDDPRLEFRFFDWLTAYEDGGGFVVAAHVWSRHVRRGVLMRTRLDGAAAALPTLTGLWPGADWHERETREMFGVDFVGHPNPANLLLPDEFEGHPLRKDFALAARRRDWPGAVDPDPTAGTGRRRLTPPGAVPPVMPPPAPEEVR